MTDRLLTLIDGRFPLEEIPSNEFAKMKVGPMTFTLSQYYAKGLGNVSYLHGSAMLGLMKMDTLVVNPFEKDAPLFSYDRIFAMGNDTILSELYDTRIDKSQEITDFAEVIAEYNSIPNSEAKPCWYDNMKIPNSIRKKGKKKQTPLFDELASHYLETFLALCDKAKDCDSEKKKEEASIYTEGLLSNGGPSTDQFIKSKGKEFTEKLFREKVFATGNKKG